MKHTKGEWILKGRRIYVKSNILEDSGEIQIAYTMNLNKTSNAKLIAAAPELLKQLKRAIHYYGRGFEPKEGAVETIGSKLYLDIQEAIKKATL